MDLRNIDDSRKLALIVEDRFDESILLNISRPNLLMGIVEGLRPGYSLHDRITENYTDSSQVYPYEVEVTPRQARRLGGNALRQYARGSSRQERDVLVRVMPLTQYALAHS